MKFIGGKDDRKTPEGSDDDGPPRAALRLGDKEIKMPRMREGTYSNSSFEINDDGTWKLEEGGGHQFRHSRASNHINASGTWKIEGDKYLFTVAQYENTNTDARDRPSDDTGKTFERSVADVKAGKFKSLFFDIDLCPA